MFSAELKISRQNCKASIFTDANNITKRSHDGSDLLLKTSLFSLFNSFEIENL